jgi:hypothetical protein
MEAAPHRCRTAPGALAGCRIPNGQFKSRPVRGAGAVQAARVTIVSFICYPDYFKAICTREILRPELINPAPDPYSLDYPDRLPEWLEAGGGQPVPPGAD